MSSPLKSSRNSDGNWLSHFSYRTLAVRRAFSICLFADRLYVCREAERLFGDRLHGLRRHRLFAWGELEINAAVDATTRYAGWFTPVYGFRKPTPEYLLMIDRAGFGDHQAALGEALNRRLLDGGVSITGYFFQSDPRLCRTKSVMIGGLLKAMPGAVVSAEPHEQIVVSR